MIKGKDKIKEIESAEYGVDSRYKSKKDRLNDGKALMEARLKRMNNLSSYEILKAKLIQLKLRMEEFVQNPTHYERNQFTEFLTSYIDTLYLKRMSFAKDINIEPVLLSKIINKHREPKEDFLLRLMVHSEKTYHNICPFQKNIWHQVYFQEKIGELMANQNLWRPEIEKHVNIKNRIIASD